MEINLGRTDIISVELIPQDTNLYNAIITVEDTNPMGEKVLILPHATWDKANNIITSVKNRTTQDDVKEKIALSNKLSSKLDNDGNLTSKLEQLDTLDTDMSKENVLKNNSNDIIQTTIRETIYKTIDVDKAPISSFSNEYSFLNNFYNAKVQYDGLFFKNAEAAFQASKTSDIQLRDEFTKLTGSQAKIKGKELKVAKNWNAEKDNIMYNIVKDKFIRNKKLAEELLKTEGHYIVYGNAWHDNYWGKCYCKNCENKESSNILGEILMRVRWELGKR